MAIPTQVVARGIPSKTPTVDGGVAEEPVAAPEGGLGLKVGVRLGVSEEVGVSVGEGDLMVGERLGVDERLGVMEGVGVTEGVGVRVAGAGKAEHVSRRMLLLFESASTHVLKAGGRLKVPSPAGKFPHTGFIPARLSKRTWLPMPS